MNDYQQAALRTARGKDQKDELFHLLLGLCGEAGEIAEKMKKIVRDKNSDFANVDVDDMKKNSVMCCGTLRHSQTTSISLWMISPKRTSQNLLVV